MPDDISFATALTARPVPAGSSIRAGYGVCHDTSGVYYVEASTSNLAAVGEAQAEGIALEAAGGNNVPFRIAVSGYIPPSIANVGVGTAGDFVQTDANGALVRSTLQTGTTIGKANRFGGVRIQSQGLSSSNAQFIQSVAVGVPSIRGTELGFAGPANLVWNWPNELNVLLFGADRTGVSDSAPAINAAIAALGQGSGGIVGGTVVFPPGKYLVNSPITVADLSTPGGAVTGICLRGSGGASSYPNSLPTLIFNIDDKRGATALSATISSVSSGFATLTAAPGTFSASDFDCSICIWGDFVNEGNNVRQAIITQVGPAGDGSQVVYYNPSAVAGVAVSYCVGHVGLNVRSGDVVLERLRLLVGTGHKMTALVDWTESSRLNHAPLTRQIHRDVFLGCSDYSTTHVRYCVRVGRSVATAAGVVPFNPANMDYLKLYDSQYWQADEAHIGIPQLSAQSRSNVASGCDFIYAPNCIWALNGTQWDLHSGSYGGNAPVRFTECILAPGGSGPPSNFYGVTSEGASSIFRTSGIGVNIYGGHFTFSRANTRGDQVIGEVGNSQTAANIDGVSFISSDNDGLSIYATAQTSSFESSVNITHCTLPYNTRAYEPRYLPASKKGPYIFSDGDTLSFTVDGVAKSIVLHTSGTTGVPIDIDGVHRWRFGTSGSTILEAQAWEIAQLIETQVPGLSAFAYGDQSKMFVFSNSGVTGSVIATYPGGAGDPGHRLEWAPGLFINYALTQCSIDTQGYVGPGPNNSSLMDGNAYYDPATKVRKPGSNRLVRTGSAAVGGSTVMSGVQGIGASAVARNNLSGQVTVVAGSTTGTAAFSTPEADTTYRLSFGCVSSPATAGCQTITGITKSTTGFTITVATAPSGSSTVFDWHLIG